MELTDFLQRGRLIDKLYTQIGNVNHLHNIIEPLLPCFGLSATKKKIYYEVQINRLLTEVKVWDLDNLEDGEVDEALVEVGDVLVVVGGVLQLQTWQQTINTLECTIVCW